MSNADVWRPAMSVAALRQRAALFAGIRRYFASAGVMEVMTPALSRYGNTDPHIDSFAASGAAADRWYLHTSPEFFMKRLLAAGSGDIYQLCSVFRDEPQGRWHNPEFAMLEWYRVGYDEFDLMRDVEALLQSLGAISATAVPRLTYADALQAHSGMDVGDIDRNAWLHCLAEAGIDVSATIAESLPVKALRQLVFSQMVEPRLPPDGAFVHAFPVDEASLAAIAADGASARRFEFYLRGVELANGFFELCDGTEQANRFAEDNQIRRQQGLLEMPVDRHLLAALAAGLPSCAGVALGVDRLFALLLDMDGLTGAQPFPFDRV